MFNTLLVLSISYVCSMNKSIKSIIDILKGFWNISKSLKSIEDKIDERIERSENDDSLRQRIKSLEAELESMKDWEKEKARYAQKYLYGFLLYQIKRDSIKQDEQIHCICPKCCSEGRKSFLHNESSGGYDLYCFKCGKLTQSMNPSYILNEWISS